MSKQLLISYTGKMPVEIDLAKALKLEETKARKEKRESLFQKLSVVKSGTLTLRKNTTAVVSPSELEVIKSVMGDLFFKRNVVEHGEYKPRAEKPQNAPEKVPIETKGKGSTVSSGVSEKAPSVEVTVSGTKKSKGKK